MKKLVTVVGARPQFIKAATVSRAIGKRSDVREVLVHTGQHYDANMSKVFFEEMAIPQPDYNLGVGGGNHGAMTGRQLEKIEEVLLIEKPDWLLVYGDTNSTLAGALAAAKLHIPVAHVEAGLRSFNRRMPEEINRILTDHAANLLFAPTATARHHLLREGIADEKIHVVGDVMYDAVTFYRQYAAEPVWFGSLNVRKEEFLLCTIHRAENTDNPVRLRSIFNGLGEIRFPVILPLHPRTLKKLDELAIHVADNIHVTAPVGYLEMIWLEMNSRLIATDSGGVQKEAYFQGRPCVTLRDETEWVELVNAGWNIIAPPVSERWIDALTKIESMKTRQSVDYGNGSAAASMVDILASMRCEA